MSQWKNCSGGFWDTPKVNYSDDTKKFLNTLISEAKLANSFKQSIHEAIKNGGSLNANLKTDSKECKMPEKKKRNAHKIRSLKPSLRTKELIEKSGAYDPVPYRPPPVPLKTDSAEKLRFAYLMSYGQEPNSKNNKQYRMKNPKNTDENYSSEEKKQDRFEEITEEIKDRRQFLAQMESLGRGKEYRSMIESEISQLIREMELVDQKRSKELEQIEKK